MKLIVTVILCVFAIGMCAAPAQADCSPYCVGDGFKDACVPYCRAAGEATNEAVGIVIGYCRPFC